MKEKIRKYIEDSYDYNIPILSAEIKGHFPDIKMGTIRQILRRLKSEKFISQSAPGTFFRPEESGIFKKASITTEQIIQKRYLFDDKMNPVGYVKGFNFANKISLSSQTSHITEIVSNKVSDKKRRIVINKRVITIEAPRTLITKDNYKLMQVLDLFVSFEKYSELDFLEAKPKILEYISEVNLSASQLNDLVSKYPIKVQLKFYRLGEIDGITQTQ